MPVDPQFLPILEQSSQSPPIDLIPIALVRQLAMPRIESEVALAMISDIEVPGAEGAIKARLYRPTLEPGLPLIIYMHGGGYIIGDLDTHDDACRNLAALTPAVVLSLDYRLAPEHPFPAAPDDCLAALRWAGANAASFGADPDRIAVAGDSAGAALATVMALRVRDEGGPALRAQVLIYPAADLVDASDPPPSADGKHHLLTPRMCAYFGRCYMGETGDMRHPHASPAFAEDLAGLPPALVITAEYDPLCTQGEAFAGRLQEAGVAVTLSRYDGAIHGFFTMPAPMGGEAHREAAAWLGARFQS